MHNEVLDVEDGNTSDDLWIKGDILL